MLFHFTPHIYTLCELLKEEGSRTKGLTLFCGSENVSRAWLNLRKIPKVAIKIVFSCFVVRSRKVTLEAKMYCKNILN